jgi:hypothetical protein
MSNYIQQAKKIILGNDGGQCAFEMFERINKPENQEILKKAYQARVFFSNGWFRFFRKSLDNQNFSKINKRDNFAFAELIKVESLLKQIKTN